MNVARVLVTALVLASALPAARASEPPTCAEATSAPAAPGGLYAAKVTGHSAQYDVWRESNGVEGLQKTECLAADGTLVAADHHVGVFGIDTGGQPFCVPRIGCIY